MSVINFQKEIPHELMHALGLDHTFLENKLPNKKSYLMREVQKIIWIITIKRKLLSNGSGMQ
jgi:hypothetical protein